MIEFIHDKQDSATLCIGAETKPEDSGFTRVTITLLTEKYTSSYVPKSLNK